MLIILCLYLSSLMLFIFLTLYLWRISSLCSFRFPLISLLMTRLAFIKVFVIFMLWESTDFIGSKFASINHSLIVSRLSWYFILPLGLISFSWIKLLLWGLVIFTYWLVMMRGSQIFEAIIGLAVIMKGFNQ